MAVLRPAAPDIVVQSSGTPASVVTPPLTFTGPTLPRFAMHALAWQVVLAPQTLPQLPQLELSLVVSMQAVTPASFGHAVRPMPHVVPHVPLLHDSPEAHALPHPPQFDGSTLVSTHELPHCVVPPPHDEAHAPCEQTCP